MHWFAQIFIDYCLFSFGLMFGMLLYGRLGTMSKRETLLYFLIPTNSFLLIDILWTLAKAKGG